MLFWDASALVKAYSDEPGTDKVRGAFKVTRREGSLLTELVLLEVLTVLTKHLRSSLISGREYTAALKDFDRDAASAFDFVEVDGPTRRRAFQLARQHGRSSLGAMDLLHLAAALSAQKATGLQPIVFATSDVRLQAAARAEGLLTFNPEADPLSKLLRLLSN